MGRCGALCIRGVVGRGGYFVVGRCAGEVFVWGVEGICHLGCVGCFVIGGALVAEGYSRDSFMCTVALYCLDVMLSLLQSLLF